MEITKEEAKKVIANREFDTPIGQEILFRMYYLKFGIGFENPSPSDLKERIYDVEQLSDYGIAQLSGEWVEYSHYRIDKRKEKDLPSLFKNLSFIGWVDETWFLINIYSKEKIASLERFYIGVKRYINTNIEEIYDEDLVKIYPRYKRDLERIKERRFDLLSDNLQKVFSGEKIPIENLTDYEIKLIKSALWLEEREQDEKKKYFKSVAEIYNSLLQK
jgi:hypothetical protein